MISLPSGNKLLPKPMQCWPRSLSICHHKQCSGLSWKSCWSWSEFWEIQTFICKEMCKKFLVLTKSCRSQTSLSLWHCHQATMQCVKCVFSNLSVPQTFMQLTCWLYSHTASSLVGVHCDCSLNHQSKLARTPQITHLIWIVFYFYKWKHFLYWHSLCPLKVEKYPVIC